MSTSSFVPMSPAMRNGSSTISRAIIGWCRWTGMLLILTLPLPSVTATRAFAVFRLPVVIVDFLLGTAAGTADILIYSHLVPADALCELADCDSPVVKLTAMVLGQALLLGLRELL